MDNLNSSWHCARTKPKHEHIAAAGLTRNLGLEVFHPRLRMERRTRRGVVRVIEPLFPCYIFVRLTSADRLEDIRYSQGVSSLVRFGQQLATVPDAVIDELRESFELDEPRYVADHLCAGAEVTLSGGPFLGSTAVVVRSMPSGQRVQILLDFLGRSTLTEVDRRFLVVENSCLAERIPSLATSKIGRSGAAA
ncbi:MAG: hypothetical protein K9N62_00705 [Verrucomicrobia bacterium]|nr:hypothetical protein [Verrucomicrobiota bacterium]